MRSVVNQHGVDLVGNSGDQVAQEVGSDTGGGLLVQFDKGELRRPVDGDQQIQPALSRADFRDVDVEITDRISLELAFGRGLAFDLRQLRDAMALQAAVQG
jgi:hypothetical protein